jgi:hypothetical protein
MALGVAALIALTARWPALEGRRRALRWGVRLLALGLIAAGVALGWSGVWDV